MLVEQLQAIIDDPMTPHTLASLTGQTLKFVPQLAELEDGQEEALADSLSEMNERDGGTCVALSGWHEKDEETALADRRGERLFAYFRSRASANVLFTVRKHVCGQHCSQEAVPILRRIGWVDIRWQPRNVMLEDIRITALTRRI